MRYDFRCTEHGVFEIQQSLSEHTGVYDCPTCAETSKQVILRAPGLNTEAMADVGMPGAFMKSGDRMEKRHKAAGQDHHYWRDDIKKVDAAKTAERMGESSAWEGTGR